MLKSIYNNYNIICDLGLRVYVKKNIVMSIVRPHLQYFREIFKLDVFWKEPFLMIGLPTIVGIDMPWDFSYKNLKDLVENRGLKKVDSLDYYDKKADLKLDLNKATPVKYHNKYKVVADFGTIEHIFDTRRCLENYLRMTSVQGIVVLNTAVNGYFGHGLHVFNPEGLIEALKINNFEVIYQKYTSSTGIEVEDPSIKKNILIWVVAKKIKPMKKFVVPQQKMWKKYYSKKLLLQYSEVKNQNIVEKMKILYRERKRRFINKIPKDIRNLVYGRV